MSGGAAAELADLTHDPKKAAVAALAVAGMAVMVLIKNRRAGATAGTPVAGLTGPDTQATNVETDVQNMLNDFWQQLHPDTPAPKPGTPAPTPKPGPKTPKPAPTPKPPVYRQKPPAPAHTPTPPSTFTIGHGGTLYGAAVHFYGAKNATKMLGALAAKNHIKLTVNGGQSFARVYAGQKIVKA